MDSRIYFTLPLLLSGACGSPTTLEYNKPDKPDYPDPWDDETGSADDDGGGPCEERIVMDLSGQKPLDFIGLWAADDRIVAASSSGVTTFDGSDWAYDATDELRQFEQMWANDVDDVYLLSDGGITHWDGEQFELERATPPVAYLEWEDRFMAIWGSGPTEMWAAGRSMLNEDYCYTCDIVGLVESGPGTWSDLEVPSQGSLYAIHGAADTVIVGGYEAWALTEGTWSPWPDPPSAIRRLWTADGVGAWATTHTRNEVLRGSAQGWESFDLEALAPVEGESVGLTGRADDEVYFASGNEDLTRVLRWDGAQWSLHATADVTVRGATDTDPDLQAQRRLVATDDRILLAATDEGAEVWRVDPDASERIFSNQAPGGLDDLYALTNGTAIAVGQKGLFRYDGQDWVRLAKPGPNVEWVKVAGRAVDDIVVSTLDDQLLRWDGLQMSPMPWPGGAIWAYDLHFDGADLWVLLRVPLEFGEEELQAARWSGGSWEIHTLRNQSPNWGRFLPHQDGPWAVTGDRLWRWKGDGFVRVDVALNGHEIRDAAIDFGGTPWLIVATGLYSLENGTLIPAPFTAGIEWQAIDASDDVWVRGEPVGLDDAPIIAHKSGASWTSQTFAGNSHWSAGDLVVTASGAVYSDWSGPISLRIECE